MTVGVTIERIDEVIILKSQREIALMKRAGRILADCHMKLAEMIQPGVTTLEIDRFVDEFLNERGAKPEQKGYKNYQYAVFASLNDEMCHGFPRPHPLNEGDIITIDIVVNYKGALADSAWSFAVGAVSGTTQQLLEIGEKALHVGIAQAVIGNRIGDIGHAIERYVKSEDCFVSYDFGGHGIGYELHEDPLIPHYGKPGRGTRLKEGMVIALEPIVSRGNPESKMDENNWTARTTDGGLAVQFEHTLAITPEGPIVLTV